jgi:hypothetical protein
VTRRPISCFTDLVDAQASEQRDGAAADDARTTKISTDPSSPVAAGGASHELAAAADKIRATAAERHPWLGDLQVAGIGWATVELERAAAQFDDLIHNTGTDAPGWSRPVRDDLLGATAWMREGYEPALLLLEPDTEGRLAASLTRFGEGIAAVYLALTERSSAAIDTANLGSPALGPLGPERLLLNGPAWGPHVLVLESTPDPAALDREDALE